MNTIIDDRKSTLTDFMRVFGGIYHHDTLATALLSSSKAWEGLDFDSAKDGVIAEMVEEGRVRMDWVGTGQNGYKVLERKKDAVYRLVS